jgi:hypothetical protein
MNIVIDPITGFYLVGAIVLLGMILLALPTILTKRHIPKLH